MAHGGDEHGFQMVYFPEFAIKKPELFTQLTENEDIFNKILIREVTTALFQVTILHPGS